MFLSYLIIQQPPCSVLFSEEIFLNASTVKMASKESSDSTNSIEQMSFTESSIQEAEYTQNSPTRTIVTVAEMPRETIIAQETMPPGVTVATDPGGQDNDTESRQKEICDSGETVTFKVIYNKQKYDLTFPMDKTVLNLKDHIKTLTGVPSSMQKLMYKGLANDESTLRDLNVTNASKIMVVGSTMKDVLQVTRTPNVKELQEGEKAVASKEPLSQLKQHKLVIDKYGKPDDVLPGMKGKRERLPHQPITGMYNKSGGKVRLTFKLELDQLWLGTKERTEKLPMNSIKAVVSEPIVGYEEYHMLALQLGPTEASRYWIYWVPAQYADAIKDTVMGKWQLF